MAVYLSLLKRHALRFRLGIIAYCLMSNHIHLVVIPGNEKSMADTIGKTHGHFAQHINRKMNSKGHLWEDRYYSCPMDDAHFLLAARYVERNPVKAGIVTHPWDYQWSSAAAHINGFDILGLLNLDWWNDIIGNRSWVEYVDQPDLQEEVDALVKNTREGKPLGDEKYFEAFNSTRW